jgi:hypothetical protein
MTGADRNKFRRDSDVEPSATNIPDLPLDTNGMPGMAELLGETTALQKIRKRNDPKRVGTSTRIPKVNEILPLELTDMPDMDALLENEEMIPPLKPETEIHSRTETRSLPRQRKLRKKSKKKYGDILRFGQYYVVDGSNVCRSYLDLDGNSSLAPLLTLVHAILKRRARCRCIFDANERYVLRRNSREPEGERIYEELLRGFSRVFTEVPGSSNADDYILALADREELSIISNDRFTKLEDQHAQRYPWLSVASSRLIRGTVEDDILVVPDLGLSIQLRHDVESLVDEIRNLLRS